MTYDEWKTRSPDDEYPYDDELLEDDCCHEDFDSDWEGRATCMRCGHTWWRTTEDMARDEARGRDFDAYVRREMRRERIEYWFGWLAFWRRWRKPKLSPVDDEIPF